jgi:hypothetical protein
MVMSSNSLAQAATTEVRSMKVSASLMTADHSEVVVASAADSKLSNQTSPRPVYGMPVPSGLSMQ